MWGIYNYTPETNHVSRVQSVAAIWYLQYVVLIMLFHILHMFLYSTDFTLSWYVANVFPKWPSEGSSYPYYYWYHFCFYIIIIKIADNINAIPQLELCSTECSEVTSKGLNDEWETYVLENLLLMDVTSIWRGGSFNVPFPQNLTQ
jgi:hypothetical protein